ncbi:MAG: putative DNA modification/repair radical SAM protein [Clostridiales bacterium]
MNISTKIKILSDSAKYDVSCSSSGSTRKSKKNGIGNSSISGICHTWSTDGRCISLLKILFTNRCIYDCAYCINRNSNDIERTSFTPEEISDLTINFYIRNYIEGLFLSSAIEKNPNYTMELLLKTVKLLREKHNFNGYIHLKAIPGADNKLIHLAGQYVDRLSVNIELPSQKSLELLAPQKNKNSILTPMKFINNKIKETNDDKNNKFLSKKTKFVPAGQSTQLIIGATDDSDYKILSLTEGLYKNYNLKRVYYSAYVPVSNHPALINISKAPLLREHRIYQADWLLRFYGFKASELLNERNSNFNQLLDPKSDWAIRNIDFFPIEINNASYHELIRVPGIGGISAKKILSARKMCILKLQDLKKLNVSIKKSIFFITINGKFFGDYNMDISKITNKLSINPNKNLNILQNQISIFDPI